MNELFEAGDAPKRVPATEPGAIEIAYDDELDTDAAYRYVIRRPSGASADSPSQ